MELAGSDESFLIRHISAKTLLKSKNDSDYK